MDGVDPTSDAAGGSPLPAGIYCELLAGFVQKPFRFDNLWAAVAPSG